MALVDVIADRRVDRARALADGDGDALTVGQGDHDRSAGNRSTQRGCIDNGAAFSHRRRGGQGHGGGVTNIGDRGGNRCRVSHQVLVVTTADPGYLSRDCGMALVSVVADWRVDGAGALADGNGDVLAVGQGDHDWAAGDWGVDRCGVDDGPAFGDRWGGGQGDGGGVSNIGDAGGNRALVRHQVLVVAAADTGDVCRDGSMTLISVVADRRADGTGALSDRDGDALAVGQGDHDRAADDGRPDRCGVNDGAAFSNRRRSSQSDGSGVGYVGDARRYGSVIGYQILVVAPADAGDAIGDRRMALVRVVADQRADGASALTDSDGDALAIGQGHHDRAASDRSRHAGGVDNSPAFGNRCRRGQ
ncbi:hypothetical protein PSRE111525_12445 [Pseudomonas reidholzensis]